MKFDLLPVTCLPFPIMIGCRLEESGQTTSQLISSLGVRCPRTKFLTSNNLGAPPISQHIMLGLCKPTRYQQASIIISWTRQDERRYGSASGRRAGAQVPSSFHIFHAQFSRSIFTLSFHAQFSRSVFTNSLTAFPWLRFAAIWNASG